MHDRNFGYKTDCKNIKISRSNSGYAGDFPLHTAAIFEYPLMNVQRPFLSTGLAYGTSTTPPKYAKYIMSTHIQPSYKIFLTLKLTLNQKLDTRLRHPGFFGNKMELGRSCGTTTVQMDAQSIDGGGQLVSASEASLPKKRI